MIITTTNLRVEHNERGEEMARVTVHVETWDGGFHFHVGVRNEGSKDHVLEELRTRLFLVFERASQQIAQGGLNLRENPENR